MIRFLYCCKLTNSRYPHSVYMCVCFSKKKIFFFLRCPFWKCNFSFWQKFSFFFLNIEMTIVKQHKVCARPTTKIMAFFFVIGRCLYIEYFFLYLLFRWLTYTHTSILSFQFHFISFFFYIPQVYSNTTAASTATTNVITKTK